MGRMPCCAVEGVHKGTWSAQEDSILINYIRIHGEGKWTHVPRRAGLKRCGKSCRMRWLNYLRPDIKRGNISEDEEDLIIRLHKLLGNRWSLIAGRLPGRTDNEIKNYWNTILKKKVEEQKGSLDSNKQLQNPLGPQEASNQEQVFPTKTVVRCSNKVIMNPPPLDIVLPHMMEKNMKSTERPSSSTTFEKDDSLDRLMDLDIDDFLLSETPNSQPLDHGSHYENMAGGGCNLYSNILCGQNFPLSTSEMELDLLIDKAGPENLNLFDPYLQPNNALDFKSSPTFLGLEENWIF